MLGLFSFFNGELDTKSGGIMSFVEEIGCVFENMEGFDNRCIL